MNLILLSLNPLEIHQGGVRYGSKPAPFDREGSEFPVEEEKKHLQTQILRITDVSMIYGITSIGDYKVSVQ